MHRQKVIVKNVDQNAGEFAIGQRDMLAAALKKFMRIREIVDEVMAGHAAQDTGREISAGFTFDDIGENIAKTKLNVGWRQVDMGEPVQ